MSYERIFQLCEELAVVARDLRQVRTTPARTPSLPIGTDADLESFWGSENERPSRAASSVPDRWYESIEPIFRELELLVRTATDDVHGQVLADTKIMASLPRLHQIRAAYEYDKEMSLALALLASHKGAAQLSGLLDRESFWAFSADMRLELDDCDSIAVVGSGPLPLTALSILREKDIQMTCFERDPFAFEVGQKVIGLSGIADHVQCVEVDALSFQDYSAFDAVIAAVLVGVDMEDTTCHIRGKIAEHLTIGMRLGARFIVREPHGLGLLFHPPLGLEPSSYFDYRIHLPTKASNEPYRSAVAVLQRTEERAQ